MGRIIPKDAIESRIHTIRDRKVMLDFDIAELYGVETKALKRAVKRNSERFPDDFMFELTLIEYSSLRRQIDALKREQHAKFSPDGKKAGFAVKK